MCTGGANGCRGGGRKSNAWLRAPAVKAGHVRAAQRQQPRALPRQVRRRDLSRVVRGRRRPLPLGREGIPQEYARSGRVRGATDLSPLRRQEPHRAVRGPQGAQRVRARRRRHRQHASGLRAPPARVHELATKHTGSMVAAWVVPDCAAAGCPMARPRVPRGRAGRTAATMAENTRRAASGPQGTVGFSRTLKAANKNAPHACLCRDRA